MLLYAFNNIPGKNKYISASREKFFFLKNIYPWTIPILII